MTLLVWLVAIDLPVRARRGPLSYYYPLAGTLICFFGSERGPPDQPLNLTGAGILLCNRQSRRRRPRQLSRALDHQRASEGPRGVNVDMTTTGRGTRTRLFTATMMWVGALAPVVHGQDAPRGKPGTDAPALLREMVGTWDVRQGMWLGPNTKAIDLPPAVARRRLIEGAYLEETMTLAEKSE